MIRFELEAPKRKGKCLGLHFGSKVFLPIVETRFMHRFCFKREGKSCLPYGIWKEKNRILIVILFKEVHKSFPHAFSKRTHLDILLYDQSNLPPLPILLWIISFRKMAHNWDLHYHKYVGLLGLISDNLLNDFADPRFKTPLTNMKQIKIIPGPKLMSTHIVVYILLHLK